MPTFKQFIETDSDDKIYVSVEHIRSVRSNPEQEGTSIISFSTKDEVAVKGLPAEVVHALGG